MLFNSIDFAVFFPFFFIGYWLFAYRNTRRRNLYLIVASYFFYSWWDWRFLILIATSTLIDFFIGKKIQSSSTTVRRKGFLIFSLAVNLGLLGVFKYYDFFVHSLIEAYRLFGMELEIISLSLILPVGISFYTFQTMSYSIDVYRGHIKATDDLPAFAAFVSFFPQLVAGPIERAASFLPAFSQVTPFNYERAVSGLRQVLWGLFKKVVIADQCAYYVDPIFAHSASLPGSTLLLGAVFFAFQIYGDFSGYTDIAIGMARIFGFELQTNFRTPYFSRSVAEFWRRWHISLSTWFRDYVYIPLGGNRGGQVRSFFNILVVFTLSGLWHGANWTFVIWGLLHALSYLPLFLLGTHRKHLSIRTTGKGWRNISDFVQIVLTFLLITILWIFFRAEHLPQAINMVNEIVSQSLFTFPALIEPVTENPVLPRKLMLLLALFVAVEWNGQTDDNLLNGLLRRKPLAVRWVVYFVLAMAILLTIGQPVQFIYFQF